MVCRALLVVALLGWLPPAALADSPVRFAEEAEITLPDGYSHRFEDERKTIVVHPSRQDLFEYRLTFHSLVQYLAQRPRITEEFVSSMAEKKGKQLRTIRGTSHKAFVEAGAPSNVNGETVRNLHGVVAMREGYTTMTLTVPEKYANNPAVREFVAGGMERLLATLRYVGK